MPAINDDKERHVIPRWRTFASSVQHGELRSLGTRKPAEFSDAHLELLGADFSQTRSPSIAADLVASAFTLGRFDIARDAAQFLETVENISDMARSVAQCYLSRGNDSDGVSAAIPPLVEEKAIAVDIHAARAVLRVYPANSIQWMNLALLYVIAGEFAKARRAVVTSLSLAPHDRFVLRAASRFFVHRDDIERARHIINTAPNVLRDPWLLAADIALAGAARKSSPNLKKARSIVDAGKFSPAQISELASAVATQEAFSGNVKRARQLLRLSLEEPTENAVAQAAWLARNVVGAAIIDPAVTCSFEANAWFNRMNSDWRRCILNAQHWQNDQPFSSRPATFGSHIAAQTLEQYDLAERIARLGLRSNPQDFNLHNNLAFALAQMNRIPDAMLVLHRVSTASLSQSNQIAFNATLGLLAFKSGATDRGRELYKKAINLADLMDDDERATVAKVYFAIEELKRGSQFGLQLRHELLATSVTLKDPASMALLERFRKTNDENQISVVSHSSKAGI